MNFTEALALHRFCQDRIVLLNEIRISSDGQYVEISKEIADWSKRSREVEQLLLTAKLPETLTPDTPPAEVNETNFVESEPESKSADDTGVVTKNVEKPTPNKKEQLNQQLIALYNQGKTYCDIASEIGLSVPAVNQRLMRLREEGKVQKRSRKGPKKQSKATEKPKVATPAAAGDTEQQFIEMYNAGNDRTLMKEVIGLTETEYNRTYNRLYKRGYLTRRQAPTESNHSDKESGKPAKIVGDENPFFHAINELGDRVKIIGKGDRTQFLLDGNPARSTDIMIAAGKAKAGARG